jgi:excinuclease ABC subunit A
VREPGFRGGEVLYNGDKTTFLGAKTKTSESLVHWKQQCRAELAKNKTFQKSNGKIVLKGAQGNNLKNVNLEIPLKSLVVVTGVSGSGKSTLIVDTLFQALSKMFHGQSEPISKFRSLEGFEYLNNIELIDQSAIGKSTRSNPITFIKGFDEIRYLFSQTPESIAKNYFPGHFSFNVAGGRCETCEGEGRVKIDMVFMEDVTIPCEVCNEKRFKPEILNVRYRGKNIDDVLKMTVDEAYDFFKSISTLKSKLALLQEVGLGYLTLGQPGFSLSGGEAQRLKIAKELSQGVFARRSTLFILDEPTTGLHFDEITKLIGVLRQLIHNGHSVVVIEHNVQLICHADYLIDLGPEGGSAGGKIVDKGTPQEVLLKKKSHTGKYLSEILGENKL